MNFFNEIGKAASYAANAVGDAAKKIDVEAIGNEIGKAAKTDQMTLQLRIRTDQKA